jgi:tetratricopeptide repeat protein 19, mitochondrial
VQREEFAKAEQMFHIALRMAQTVQHQLAETYIFDLMGNLAYESNQLEKAEKIFVNVIQRLMQIEKAAEDDPRLLHISTKIAHIAYLKNDFEKALLGFGYVLEKIEKRDYMNDENLFELWGLTKNFLGQVLISNKEFEKAKLALLDAQKIFLKFKAEVSEDGMILLNNLSVCCAELKEFDKAEKYLIQAIEIAKQLKLEDISPYKINLGMLYFKQKLIEKAQEACKAGWLMAIKYDNKDAVGGAETCLDQVKRALS